jgi:hypothetical protein
MRGGLAAWEETLAIVPARRQLAIAIRPHAPAGRVARRPPPQGGVVDTREATAHSHTLSHIPSTTQQEVAMKTDILSASAPLSSRYEAA